MKKAARAWLPSQALDRRSIEAAVQRVMHAWAQNWFDRPTEIRIGAPLGDSDGSLIENVGGDAVAVHADVDAIIAIGAQCGGLELTSLVTARDRALCKLVGQSALSDAQARLTQIALPSAMMSGAAYGADVGIAKRHRFHVSAQSPKWAIVIDASEAAIIAIRRGKDGSAPNPLAVAPDAMSQALSTQNIVVGAKVGMARLPIGAARDLAIGDVLILDRPISQAMPITIDGATARNGSVHLIAEGASVSLEIEQPIDALAPQ